jgi:restriction endonuclease S subunit
MQADKTATGAAQKTVSLNSLRSFVVPLPPLSVQHRIVAELEAERALVEANRELIARMEAKIKAKLAEIWGST